MKVFLDVEPLTIRKNITYVGLKLWDEKSQKPGGI
jgi:hypothetical protein